jgi:hypothetical protein
MVVGKPAIKDYSTAEMHRFNLKAMTGGLCALVTPP